jgi:hypothetical protein
MDTLTRLIASLGRGFLVRGLWRFIPRGARGGWLGVLLGIVLLLVVGLAHASGNVIPTSTTYSSYTTGGRTGPTKAAACAAHDDGTGGDWAYPGTGDQCFLNARGNPQYSFTYISSVGPPTVNCPSGALYQYDPGSYGNACVCQDPYTASSDATYCVGAPPPPPPETLCKAGNVVGDVTPQLYRLDKFSSRFCDGTCNARFTAVFEGSAPGTYWAWGPYTLTGGTCTGGTENGQGASNTIKESSPNISTQPTPDPSKPGYCPGTVNGTPVSVPCKTSKTEVQTDTESAASPASGASSSSTGKTSEVKETTCNAAGACTTTITTVSLSADGTSKTGTTKGTTDAESSDLCKANPQLAICQVSGFGGNCAGGFTCKGDAIQCAIAKAELETQCEFTKPTDASAIGLAAAAAASGPAIPASSATFTLEGRIDSTPLFGGTACTVTDGSVSVGGQTLALPFSHMCESLNVLSLALRAFAFLVAGFIVFRRGH